MGEKRTIHLPNEAYEMARNTDQAEKDRIKDEVFAANGNVLPDTARRFINICYYNTNKNFERVNLLPDLDLDLKLNLYKSLALDMRQNAAWMDLVNQELGLTDQFFENQLQDVRQFFHQDNMAWLEAQWKQKDHDGLFAEAMTRQFHGFKSLYDEESREVIKFLIESYFEFHHRPVPEIILDSISSLRMSSNTKAHFAYRLNGQPFLELNLNASWKDFSDVIDSTIHESEHGNQDRLIRELSSGQIQSGHKDYIPAKVFTANDAGYLREEFQINGQGMVERTIPYTDIFNAYVSQPKEADSRKLGALAGELAYCNYASLPLKPKEEKGVFATIGNTISAALDYINPF